MEHYHFSGVDRTSFVALLAREGASGMVNALCAIQPAMLAAYQRFPEVRLVLDSAAFQGNVNISGYAEIVKALKDRFLWSANLDVIGDQTKSDENWEVLQSLGAETLWVYQAKGGKDIDYLSSRADRLRFIGVGGLVPIIKNSVSEAIDLIGEIGNRLKKADTKAHFFGVGSPVILSQFASQSWFYSADSQSWLCGMKAREMIRRDGTRMKSDHFGLSFTGEECAAQNIRQIHGWMQGKPLQLAMI